MTNQRLSMEDLDEVFGPGLTVNKADLLAAINAHDHRVAGTFRTLLNTKDHELTDEEARQGATALRRIRDLADGALGALADAQAQLRLLRQSVDREPVINKVIKVLLCGDAPPPTDSVPNADTPPTSGTEANPSGEAPTIDDLRACALSHGTERDEDVILKDGRVFYASGRPFDGVLSHREVQLLQSCGRLLSSAAAFPSRTAKYFVKLDRDLL